jgi:hypothetical protein
MERQITTVTERVTLDGVPRQRDVLAMITSRLLVVALSTALPLAVAACGDDSGGNGPPVAPSGLSASPLSGGAHLTWTDNSDNEVEFMVMRMRDGVDAEYSIVASVEFVQLDLIPGHHRHARVRFDMPVGP